MNHHLDPINKIVHENDKALRNVFGKYIKGNFLIEMKHFIMDNNPDLYNYYDLSMTTEKMVSGSDDFADYDVCRMIVGCHSSNTIFLGEEQRRKLEKDTDYKIKLKRNVLENISVRRYGSVFFRKTPIIQGDSFIFYNVPYWLFVVSMKINEMLAKKVDNYHLYASISNKSLAALSLLEDNFLDNAYPICRSLIELYLKLVLCVDNDGLFDLQEKFRGYEIEQSCCSQKYPETFNELYNKRINKSKETSKIDYLHYGWLDAVPKYHDIVKYRPYSVNGILAYLKEIMPKENSCFYKSIEVFYKMCHGYTHGNVPNSRYPLLHYFEISKILYFTVVHTFNMLCNTLNISTEINGINASEKLGEYIQILDKQYEERSTERFNKFYNRNG